MRNTWYAVRVRSRGEQLSATYLRSLGYDVFAPTYPESRRYCDRTKDVQIPFFPGYVLCNLDIDRRLPVLQAVGVIDIVRFGNQFIPVDPDELRSMRTLIQSAGNARPAPFLSIGDVVTVNQGPLAGVKGILVQIKGSQRLLLSISLLQRSVSAEVDRHWVELAA